MITIYPSKHEEQPLETHRINTDTTLAGWLHENVPGFSVEARPRISISVNGGLIAPAQWAATKIGSRDDVRIYIEPKDSTRDWLLGLAFPFAAPYFIGKALYGAFKMELPNSRSVRGEDLDTVSVK